MNSLRNRLLAMPVLMICIVCVILIFMFNVVMAQFIDTQVKDSFDAFVKMNTSQGNLEEELAQIEGYDDKAQEERNKIERELEIIEQEVDSAKSTVTTQMIPLNDDKYISEFANDAEKKLVGYYKENEGLVKKKDIIDVGIDGASYRIKVAKLVVHQGMDPEETLIYTNISTLNGFMRSVNKMLAMVVAISAVLSILLGLFMTKRVTDALIALREFVEELREGERRPDKSEISYREFVQLANHVEELSDELNDAQKLQKLIFQNASHELRTPLMSIQGYAEGISTNVLKNHQMAADVIITESKKMSELVDEMLFISRMDEQELTEDDMTILELRSIIEDCREEICVVGEKKGVVIIESLDGGKYFIKGEEKQITKALANVMSNGIRYAQEKLAITGSCADDRIIITISDDGNGISEKDLPHVFERFYKGEGGNFGIGLSITKDIVERHGGSITAENNTTKGAKFTIVLPAVKVEDQENEKEVGVGITTADDAMLRAVIDSIPEEDRLI